MRKYISGILSFCLVFTQLPEIAFAAPAEEMQKMPSKATAVMEESSENMTTFDLGDGLKQAVFYGSDVRFLSEDGRLTDYEPELVKVRDNKSESGKPLSDFAWKNKKGDSIQYFPKTLSMESPVLMEKDGYAIYHMLPAHNIVPVIITGRSSDIVAARAKELKITELHQGVSDKLAVLASIAAEYGVTPDQIAYIGDDLNDLDAMSYCGYTACPADAVDAVRKAAKYVCKSNGGRGAVREFVEYLLQR